MERRVSPTVERAGYMSEQLLYDHEVAVGLRRHVLRYAVVRLGSRHGVPYPGRATGHLAVRDRIDSPDTLPFAWHAERVQGDGRGG